MHVGELSQHNAKHNAWFETGSRRHHEEAK